MESTTVKCPQCGKEINVSEIIRLQLEDEYKKSYAELKANNAREHSAKLSELEKEKLEFENKNMSQF